MNIKMLKIIFLNIFKIIVFIIWLIIVFIPSYFYIYKWFIEIYANTWTKVITKEKIEEIKKYEEVVNFFDIFKKTNISKYISSFLEDNENNTYIIDLEIKKDYIKQVNNLLWENFLKEETENNIFLEISKIKNTKYSKITIKWILNNEKFLINWFFSNEENVFILQDKDLKLDWLLSLVDYENFNRYKKDNFDLRYDELDWKKIRIKKIIDIFDFNIAKRYETDYIKIFNSLDSFIFDNNLFNENEISFKINKQDLLPIIKKYITSSSKLSVWQKQELLVDIEEFISILENTDITLSNKNILIKNIDNNLIFNFEIKITKNNLKKDLITNISIDEYFLYDFKDINNIFMSKNPLLVKYLNNEDFMFLLE